MITFAGILIPTRNFIRLEMEKSKQWKEISFPAMLLIEADIGGRNSSHYRKYLSNFIPGTKGEAPAPLRQSEVEPYPR